MDDVQQQSQSVPQENGAMNDGAEKPAVIATNPAVSKDVNDRRGMAAISYLGILCVIPLVFAKDSAFAQEHAKQGLVLALIGIVLQLVQGMLWKVPFGGMTVSLLAIAVFIASVIGIIKALQGERFEIPLVSDWAKKIQF
jgi:uncharacterized membrane protein